jgi:hypothetical protein
MNRYDEEEYDHEVSAWTVGQLRAALADLDEDVPLRVEVAEEPGGSLVDLQVVIGASFVAQQPQDDAANAGEFAISCEFPPGTYLRQRR